MKNNMKKRILFVFGTRPEAIKLAPLITEFCRFRDTFDTKICITAQHREMLDQILRFFEITPGFDLDIMRPGQSLFDVTISALKGMEDVLQKSSPDWVVVQGDTTTVLAASLAAYYSKVKVAHIEAGLRSFNKYSPFPEEVNRVVTSRLADIHFSPTENAKENLTREGIQEKDIFVVGNTVIDALAWRGKGKASDRKFRRFLKGMDIQVLRRNWSVTGHRRESFGEPFNNICNAIKELSKRDDVSIVYPVHLNPNVRKPVFEILQGLKNVYLIKPLEYPAFIWLMDRSYLILTDSGGVQEEAPSLGKPVLVMRDVTERTEGIEAGTAKLVGTDKTRIFKEATLLLDDESCYRAMSNKNNPYGDGKSSERIREVMSSI
jgi:UDP-N-acetylglucosamine 2-epimerase (non-hydrolysing)